MSDKDDELRQDALQDLAYVNGAHAAFRYEDADEKHRTSFIESLNRAQSEALKVLSKLREGIVVAKQDNGVLLEDTVLYDAFPETRS
jgi:hypothetical protein